MMDSLIVNPQDGPADAGIIFLHGLSASAEDILPVVAMLQRADHGKAKLKFILPNAATMPVTMNDRMLMPSWYDIIQLDPPQVDCDGVQLALDNLDALVQQEIDSGMTAERIILIGYSQGGSVVLAYALERSQSVGGVVGLATFLPPCSRAINPANKRTPLLLIHGSYDETVPLIYAQAAADQLSEYGYQHELKVYPYEHQLGQQQLDYLAEWIKHRLD